MAKMERPRGKNTESSMCAGAESLKNEIPERKINKFTPARLQHRLPRAYKLWYQVRWDFPQFTSVPVLQSLNMF